MLNQVKLLLFLFIATILVFSSVSFLTVAKPEWKSSKLSEDSGPSITISINSAFYYDLDSDGYEDDVYTQVELHLSGANRYNFEYWLTLILPSGKDFVFGWGVNTRLTYILIGNNLYDTALETGWYTLHVEVILKTGGLSYTEAMYTFDPPGEGREGIRPTASFTIEDGW